MSSDHHLVLLEKKQEGLAGFPPCRCSNCEIKEAKIIYENFWKIDSNNFKSVMENPIELIGDKRRTMIAPIGKKTKNQTKASIELSPIQKEFAGTLLEAFDQIFHENYPNPSSFGSSVIFGMETANLIAQDLDQEITRERIDDIIGGESFDGILDCLMGCLTRFKDSTSYNEHLSNLERYNSKLDAEIARIRGMPAARKKALEVARMKAREAKKEATELKKRNTVAQRRRQLGPMPSGSG